MITLSAPKELSRSSKITLPSTKNYPGQVHNTPCPIQRIGWVHYTPYLNSKKVESSTLSVRIKVCRSTLQHSLRQFEYAGQVYNTPSTNSSMQVDSPILPAPFWACLMELMVVSPVTLSLHKECWWWINNDFHAQKYDFFCSTRIISC